MKYYDWNDEKNLILKEKRSLSFEDVVAAIRNEKLLGIVEHSNSKKYPNQKMFIVEIDSYAHIVPLVEDDEKYFLKTIYPSWEATKIYLSKEKLK
ncbi:MAG: toxin [Ignavibacteriae bacterium]|nr:toxin [Ignavibacteriota bacterium]